MGDAPGENYFEVTVDAEAVPPTVTATGELDAASSGELRRALEGALVAGHGVTLDLGEVSFIDSSALRVISVALRDAQASGQPLTVSAASDAVRRIFEITGVTTLLAP